MDVAAWLQALGLERYAPAFRDNEIDARILASLSAEDLKDLGVTLVGHRRRLLDAIAALGAADPPAVMAGSRNAPAQADAERRQLTVMFCDLVGSTALSSRLDPEDLREVMAAYHHAVGEVVAGFDGFVANYMGDGILVYFGYPRAHEDDAERAVRAGLRLIDAVSRVDVKSAQLQARIGIATGLVVVGDLIGEGSSRQQSVVGETPNLAARLQGLAEADTVVIAAATRRLVGDLFEYHDLGSVDVKGIVAPVPAWQVLHASAAESRFEALHGSALPRLIGRDEEIDLLLRRWERAKAGDGQIVLLSGEPGLGKSRITAALEERLQAEPHIRLRYFCSPYHQDSALFPFIDQLGRASGFAREDPPISRLGKLEALLSRAAPPEEDVAVLADLLSLPTSERHPLPDLSLQRKKERTLAALIRQVEGLAHRQPVVIVFEDAHWIDPTSRELLDLAVDRVRSLPALLVVTFRPEFRAPWTGQPQVSMVALNRLDRRDRTALVAQIAGGKALPDRVVAQIVERADGVPLFVEELTKSVLESGLMREEADRYVLNGALPTFAIPTSLTDSLMARLDRSASVRQIAQVGAAIGREFSYELVHAVSRLPEEELQASLARLVASELVFQRGIPPHAIYIFKHTLVQDAAHGSLLRDRRRTLHLRVAEVLERHESGLATTDPELLAYHFAEAGVADRAIDYHLKTAEHAMTRCAVAEGVSHLRRGLSLLSSLPNSRETRQRELLLQVALGRGLLGEAGAASEPSHAAFERARELCRELDDTELLRPALYGLQVYHFTRAEYAVVIRYAREILELGRRTGSRQTILVGERVGASAHLLLGRFAEARTAYEHLLALYEAEKDTDQAAETTRDPFVAGCSFLAICLTVMGYPAQGAATSQRGLSHAEHLRHAYSVHFSLRRGCIEAMLRRDVDLVKTMSARLLEASVDNETFLGVREGQLFQTWALLHEHDDPSLRERLQRSIDELDQAKTWALLPYLMAASAELLGALSDRTAAQTILARSAELVRLTDERWCQPEIMRLEAALICENSADKADLLRRSLELSHEQDSNLWKLRSTIDLAQLLVEQGRRDAAFDLLAPVCGWFTEGLGSAELKAAKALLEGLT
jgi:class 3 adenylate cyclase/tetratricopeptide (TPR) repeat protein